MTMNKEDLLDAINNVLEVDCEHDIGIEAAQALVEARKYIVLCDCNDDDKHQVSDELKQKQGETLKEMLETNKHVNSSFRAAF